MLDYETFHQLDYQSKSLIPANIGNHFAVGIEPDVTVEGHERIQFKKSCCLKCEMDKLFLNNSSIK